MKRCLWSKSPFPLNHLFQLDFLHRENEITSQYTKKEMGIEKNYAFPIYIYGAEFKIEAQLIPVSDTADLTYRSCPPFEICLKSNRSPSQMAQPLPFPLMSEFAKAVHEQFSQHLALHSSSVILALSHDLLVSGAFMLLNLMKPSLSFSLQLQFSLCTHPWVQSISIQFCGDFGLNPFKHLHTGDSPMIQIPNGPQML